MNHSDDKTGEQPDEPGRDDQDLAALFNADKAAVPEFLNARILAAAHDAVATDKAEPPATTHETTPPPPVSRNGWQHSGRWMAMAASVILVVAVAPLMLRSPESTLQTEAVDASTLKAVEQSVSVSADSAAPENEADEMASPSGAATMREAAPVATPAAPMMPAIQAQKRSLSRELSFRDTAQSWLAHIRQLQEDERYDDALTEYQLFRRRHPEYEPGFTLPLRQ